jgi:endonuclease/exonuclease/phosphatase (EEP) superfamily protein YafD
VSLRARDSLPWPRSAVTTAVGAAATAAVLLPDRLGGPRFPFVALAALRPHVTAMALGAAAALATHPRTRPLAAGVGSAALASAAALGARRGPGPAVVLAGSPTASGATASGAAASGATGSGAVVTDLTVLAANVLVGRADTGALATVLERERPDLVSLPEAGPDFRDKLLPLVAELGYQAWASTAPGTSDGEGVVLLAAARMGELTVTSGREMRHRYLRATGGALGARSFFAVHPEAPMGPVRTAWWRSDLAHVARWCAESPRPIVAGDFNATADNAAFRDVLRHCRSAADGTGRGLVGTFPAGVPPWCGIQIDHVLVPAEATTSHFAVLPIPGSDHRAVLAGIRLPTG